MALYHFRNLEKKYLKNKVSDKSSCNDKNKLSDESLQDGKPLQNGKSLQYKLLQDYLSTDVNPLHLLYKK